MVSNSSLISYTKISPNSSNPRSGIISKITIHHMAGNLTIEQCGEVFAPASRSASSNYGIGSDGRIGMYVEEKNRAWTSGSSKNDNVAITIEVANDEVGGEWHVSSEALNSLIKLCADICLRNGIERLIFTGDESGNLTMHKYFQPTACPGPYLESKFGYIASEVNKIILQKQEENNMKFKDVAETHWAAKAIDELSEKGIIKGYEDGTFRPDEPISRAEVAVMLSRLMEVK